MQLMAEFNGPFQAKQFCDSIKQTEKFPIVLEEEKLISESKLIAFFF